MTVLVVGYGNTLRGDDGAGQYVVGRVSELVGDARTLQLHQLTPELTLDLAEVDLVIFVDARADEPERGIVVEEISAADGTASSHHVSPGSLILIARRLFGRAPRGVLVSLPAYSFEYSESLSENTRIAAVAAVDLIVGLIDREDARATE